MDEESEFGQFNSERLERGGGVVVRGILICSPCSGISIFRGDPCSNLCGKGASEVLRGGVCEAERFPFMLSLFANSLIASSKF